MCETFVARLTLLKNDIECLGRICTITLVNAHALHTLHSPFKMFLLGRNSEYGGHHVGLL